MATTLLPPEAVMVGGVAEGEDLTEVVPTLVAGLVGAAVVVLAYTGAVVGTATALEVVTGLITVQGQLVIVKVVESVTV